MGSILAVSMFESGKAKYGILADRDELLGERARVADPGLQRILALEPAQDGE